MTVIMVPTRHLATFSVIHSLFKGHNFSPFTLYLFIPLSPRVNNSANFEHEQRGANKNKQIEKEKSKRPDKGQGKQAFIFMVVIILTL